MAISMHFLMKAPSLNDFPVVAIVDIAKSILAANEFSVLATLKTFVPC